VQAGRKRQETSPNMVARGSQAARRATGQGAAGRNNRRAVTPPGAARRRFMKLPGCLSPGHQSIGRARGASARAGNAKGLTEDTPAYRGRLRFASVMRWCIEGWEESRLGRSAWIMLWTATAHKLARIVYLALRHGMTYVRQSQEEYVAQMREKQIKALRRKARLPPRRHGFKTAHEDGVHPHRTPRRHRHHRPPDRLTLAGRPESPRDETSEGSKWFELEESSARTQPLSLSPGQGSRSGLQRTCPECWRLSGLASPRRNY
jgi:hypothetical protein